MILPNADRAEISPEKLLAYLLSTSHPVGRFKARFFGALGFSATNWQDLEQALRIQHLTQEAELSRDRPHGKSYSIRAILSGPNGQSAVVVSVWFIPSEQAIPRFVTAYPGEVI